MLSVHRFAVWEDEALELVNRGEIYHVPLGFEVKWTDPRVMEAAGWSDRGRGIVIRLHERSSIAQPVTPRVTAEHLTVRISNWLIEHVQTLKLFARAEYVLKELDKACTSPAQMRFMWPCVLTLCNQNSMLDNVASRIREFKAPRTIPSTTPELRALAKEAAGPITAASFIEDEVEWPGEVSIDLRTSLYYDGETGKLSAY
jgi:hypothetical protein